MRRFDYLLIAVVLVGFGGVAWKLGAVDEQQQSIHQEIAASNVMLGTLLMFQVRTYHHVVGHDQKTLFCPECYEKLEKHLGERGLPPVVDDETLEAR